ncbi:hypothetical protein GCM10022199_10490 [Marihabitans asiaticum]|uniref:ESAT-6-like protein n=1 Tax=Marihabitans asiaticum TaxID=415218 RepID=A0A560WHL9_9MICO|nr:WXG100 family type VII secretion target [Marihabitans asiaticum]TWD17066.1 WXG100 family type VII secretion target [Marihabitans asiaticum]
MGTNFSVSTDALATSSSDVMGISADIESSVSAMMGRLTALQSEWSGSAAASFQQLAADWRSTQQVVKTSLDEIAQALRAASQTYDEAEAASRAMMGGR